jgi:hypothetical protein
MGSVVTINLKESLGKRKEIVLISRLLNGVANVAEFFTGITLIMVGVSSISLGFVLL